MRTRVWRCCERGLAGNDSHWLVKISPEVTRNPKLRIEVAAMNPDLLARLLHGFLAEARSGVVFEDGQVIFDLDSAQYSISSERGRCLLHLWSAERNIVREVLAAEARRETLTLSVRGFAKARPHQLEICRDRDRRTPSA